MKLLNNWNLDMRRNYINYYLLIHFILYINITSNKNVKLLCLQISYKNNNVITSQILNIDDVLKWNSTSHQDADISYNINITIVIVILFDHQKNSIWRKFYTLSRYTDREMFAINKSINLKKNCCNSSTLSEKIELYIAIRHRWSTHSIMTTHQ